MYVSDAMRNLASFFAALADPTRLRLLHLMRDGEICVCFLQSALRTNQPKISRHLAYLRKAGLVTGRQDGKWMHYGIAPQEGELQAILVGTLKRVARETEAQHDIKRLKAIRCCPSQYGISTPSA